MTKQPKLSKAEAIKEIEKLTETKYESTNENILFVGEQNGLYLRIVEYGAYLSDCYMDWLYLPTEWLEPLSRLIPILFKNDTDTIVSDEIELCEKHNLFKEGE